MASPPLGAPLLDSTASLSISNGITAPPTLTKDDAPYDSEDSELSIPNVDDEASPASNQQSEFGAQEAQDTEASETSDAEAQDQSDDADFDMEENSPAPARNGGREQSSTSTESRRPAKRKLDLEDEHILANPELYGLRRSGRPVQHRSIIESDDDNDDSESDVVPAHRTKRRKQERSQPSSKRDTPILRSVSDSDSDDTDTYGGARARTLTKKHRRRQLESGNLAPVYQEKRWNSRRAAQVTAGAYQESDAELEDESEMMTPNYWAGETEDTTPYIDVVLKHRLKEGKDMITDDPSRDDFEYYIKWQGKSHYHATWETTTSLTGMRGFRRLENYFRKIVQEDIYMARGDDIPPEEKEKWMLDRERDADALIDYTKVERVIGTQDGEDETEYFVKWKGLYYESCTWEAASLVSKLNQDAIDQFLDRSSKTLSSDNKESNPNTRGPHVPIREQPTYIKNGQLRDFQITGLNFLAYNWTKNKNVILADEMGLGKTVQTVAFMNWLRHDRRQEGPFLVVVPLTTIPAWGDTFDHWAPDLNYIIYNGKEASRSIIREYELLIDGNVKRPKFNVLLTSYEYILTDATFLAQIKWQFMAVDEAHRLKNRESQLYQKLLDFKAPSRLLITGTPVQNTLGELSALMDFLMPGELDIEEDMDLTEEAAGEKIAALTNKIQPYILRRTKQKVENDLPPKSEKIIRVELSDVQLDYYKNILTRNYAALNEGAKGQKQSLLNIMMELKKASNHPYMFPNAEEKILKGSERREDQLKGLIASSGKMMLLDQLLTKLKRDNHRVLIFSQMVKMLDILGDYLQLRGYQFQRLDGTVAAGPRRMAIDHFNADDSNDFCFLLSTRAGGLGINLMTADTVIIFDSDWNPQADLQAMARAHRIGQKKPVSIYRLVSKETVEEEVLERARNKLMLEFITIQRGVTDKEKKELREKAVKAGKIDDPRSSEDISRILKRRGQKMFEQSGNQKKLEELDIDSVLENAEEHKTEVPEGMVADGGEDFLKSFEYTDVKIDLEWDDIIPKDQLAGIKAEEEKRAHEEYLARVVEENAPRKAAMRNTAEIEREQRLAKKRERDQAKQDELDERREAQANRADPKRELNEKEARNLFRAFLRYGSLDERRDELIKDARLVGRDIEVLRNAIKAITDESKKLLNEEKERIETLERESNKPLTKKDKKAVLFDFLGVKRLNAETVIERPEEMMMLKSIIPVAADFKNFRVPDASKAAHYSCEWGAKEDGMLLVGIHRHGYGAWVQIRDDPDLGLKEKFFLEEHRVDKKEERSKGEEKVAKAPGAVHLVRRSDYLLSVLKAKYSNDQAAKRAVENHHRNNKKHDRVNGHRRSETRGSVSASPAPQSRKNHRQPEHRSRDRERDRADSHSQGADHSTPKPDLKRKHSAPNDDRHSKSHKSENGHSKSSHQQDSMLRVIFRPVKDSLKKIQSATKERITSRKERANLMKVELVTLGNFINDLTKEEGNALEGQFWEYVASYWPPIEGKDSLTGDRLMKMYDKIVNPEVTPKDATSTSGNKVTNGTPTSAAKVKS
ncbi:related to transcriptional regulator CHD1 [Phialocephala subalpina]|uniref:Related to transcriptional regulator CHD1 n=1 Tax=Phialocephala subalpina TaxID=576137 RepID=A0A1L7X7I1_9HELO|nr:related to transcriptional regulator CHD1 [Phialocephala subalpina]